MESAGALRSAGLFWGRGIAVRSAIPSAIVLPLPNPLLRPPARAPAGAPTLASAGVSTTHFSMWGPSTASAARLQRRSVSDRNEPMGPMGGCGVHGWVGGEGIEDGGRDEARPVPLHHGRMWQAPAQRPPCT